MENKSAQVDLNLKTDNSDLIKGIALVIAMLSVIGMVVLLNKANLDSFSDWHFNFILIILVLLFFASLATFQFFIIETYEVIYKCYNCSHKQILSFEKGTECPEHSDIDCEICETKNLKKYSNEKI